MSPLLRLPMGALTRSIDAIQRVGDGEREVALFWLGDTESLTVRTVVLPTGPGVLWQPLSLRLNEAWMYTLAQRCEELDQVVLGAVHSHPEAAFMSEIDRDAFFHGPDCVSVVVPAYGRTTVADAATSWAVFVGERDNAWRRGRWGVDLEIVAGDAPLIELEGPQ